MKRKTILITSTLLSLMLASCTINLGSKSSSSTEPWIPESSVQSSSESKSSNSSASSEVSSESTSESSSQNSSSESATESSRESSSSETSKESSSQSSTSESSHESSSHSLQSTTSSSSSSYQSSSSSESSDKTSSSSSSTSTVYSITYIVDGSVYYKDTVKENETVNLKTPSKAHYTFNGWYLDSAYQNKFESNTISSNITLYASFTIEKCTITYYLDNTVFDTSSVDYSSKAVQTSKVPVKETYTFVGWSEDKNGTSSDLFDFDTEVTTDISLYAIFVKTDTLSLTCAGYNEGLYATFDIKYLNSAKAYVAKYSDDLVFSEVDSSLIRSVDSNTARVDVLGLEKGDYVLKLVTSDYTTTSEKIEVSSYDRSGYAHFAYANDSTGIDVSKGIGAYTNNGTLKSNATVVYVTEATKNTVKATINGKSYIGLANILTAQSKSSTPLDIRIIGTIAAPTWNKIDYKTTSTTQITPDKVIGANNKALSKQNYTVEEIISGGFNTLESTYEVLNGLTNKIKYDSSKDEFDSYYNMLDLSSLKNVTVEGVGTDAMIYQWGFTWKNCSSIEVRNLTFDDYTEDACSFEGSDDSQTLTGFKSGHIWIHNNNFNEGKNNWDVCNEQDKHEGDGACDLKKNAYITISYNYYYKNHKTGLVGGSDTQHTASVTFHHNYYDTCVSRLPLARQANMHMYNNYYYNSSSYSISIRANGYAFVENCYFENGQNPYELQTSTKYGNGYAKVYGCEFKNIKITNDKYLQVNNVSSRDEVLTNTNLYGTTFDTDSSVFYYKDGVSNVENLTSASKAKEECIKYSGVLKNN